MNALAINTGSSSVKYGVFDDDSRDPLIAGEIDWADGDRQRAWLVRRLRGSAMRRSRLSVPDDYVAASCAIKAAIGSGASGKKRPPKISVVGHRIVHGGAEFRESVLIDSRVKAAIARLGQLAPLHNPPALKAIEAAEAALPGVPQIAVFDTACYVNLPLKNCVYPLPYEWYRDWGIRRFGFHGISHAYCAGRAAEILARDLAQLRLVSCHLGGGCSATAVRGGIAIATTTGFSPLDGLMMGTRCGSVDPGILIHLQRRHGLTIEELDQALNYSSGLLGVSGVSPNLAQVERAATRGNERARLAFDMFAEQVRGAIAALAAALGGLDALVFTDRVGEGSSSLRAAACAGMDFIGLRLDPERNRQPRPDTDIATPDSPARILVIHTREELMVAREARRVLGQLLS
jgi:acetate kinase